MCQLVLKLCDLNIRGEKTITAISYYEDKWKSEQLKSSITISHQVHNYFSRSAYLDQSLISLITTRRRCSYDERVSTFHKYNSSPFSFQWPQDINQLFLMMDNTPKNIAINPSILLIWRQLIQDGGAVGSWILYDDDDDDD